MTRGQTFLCGANQRYARVPRLSRWIVSWPFLRLELAADAFVLRPVRALAWVGTRRFAYAEVAEAWLVRGRGYARIRVRLSDDGEGILSVTTLNDGARELAERLRAAGVDVRR